MTKKMTRTAAAAITATLIAGTINDCINDLRDDAAKYPKVAVHVDSLKALRCFSLREARTLTEAAYSARWYAITGR